MSRALDAVTYARIVDPDPDDDFIGRRKAAIGELRGRFLKKRRVSELINVVCGVCEVFSDPTAISDAIRHQVEDAIKKNDDSFVPEGRRLEIGLCAIAAINQSIASARAVPKWNGWSVSDVLAGCVWSAFSFLLNCNGRKLDALQRSTVESARNRLQETSFAARNRYRVSGVADFDSMPTNEAVHASALRTIKELRVNAMIDGEEIEFLRWVMAGKSQIHDKPFESLSAESRIVTAGFEIGAVNAGSSVGFSS